MHRSFVPVAVSAAVLAGIGWPRADARPAADPPAQASARPCLPARGLVVAMTIRRSLKDGSEVTEPLGDGGYRITRCDTHGRTTIGMTVLPIADTGGKRDLLPAVIVRRKSIVAPTYGDPVRDPRYRVVFHRALRKLLASVLPRTPGRASRDPNFATPSSVFASAAAASACDDKTHAESPGTWPDNQYSWRWNAKTFGENSSTLTALKKAHKEWDKTVTDCSGLKDITHFTTTYDGTTTRHAGVNDGVNTVDKADLSKSDVRVDRDRLHLGVAGRELLHRDRHPLRHRREVVQQGLRRHLRLPGHRRARVRPQHRSQRPR